MHYSLSGAYYLSVSTHMHREQPTATARAKVARFSCSYLCSAKTNNGRATLLGERHCSGNATIVAPKDSRTTVSAAHIICL